MILLLGTLYHVIVFTIKQTENCTLLVAPQAFISSPAAVGIDLQNKILSVLDLRRPLNYCHYKY